MSNECDNYKSITCKLDLPAPSQICFCPNPNKWCMKITSDGIIFNREEYPNSKPDDFAQAVIDILEKAFTVKFERKQPPYDRIDV